VNVRLSHSVRGVTTIPHGADRVRIAPGDGLLHPIVLVAVVTLVLNDQFLKRAWPGLITGKLSDAAGLVFFPLLIVAAAEFAASAAGRWHGPSRRWVTVAVASTGLAFAAVKLFPPAEALYEAALGLVQWPFATIAAALAGQDLAGPGAVALVADPTDLVALAALWLAHAIGSARAAPWGAGTERARTLGAEWWYELAVAGLGVALLVGATTDGWAHSRDPLSLETVLTPWHAIVYASYLLVAALLLAPLFAARLAGRDPLAAIPAGFGSSVAGVFAFAAVGMLDLVWHLAYGLEADAEALLSPTHLGLGVTAAMIASGPIRAAWLRSDPDRAGTASWPSFLPAILSVVAIAGIAAFALHIANPFVDAWPRWPSGANDVTWYGPYIGVAGAIVTTMLLAIPLLLLLRRWPDLPAGSVTLLVGGTMAGLTFLHDGQVLVGAPILGGFLVDLVLLALPPRRFGLAPVAFLGPALIFVAYFVVLTRTGPVAWSAHLIGGTVAIGGMTGLALALLTRPVAPGAPAIDPATSPGVGSADN
jgi:hypothetical protein